jgi:hypothetical protein
MDSHQATSHVGNAGSTPAGIKADFSFFELV